jgi:hypothetical protein
VGGLRMKCWRLAWTYPCREELQDRRHTRAASHRDPELLYRLVLETG